MELGVNVCSLRLAHPLMNASGVLGGYTREHIRRLAGYGLAAVVSKTLTLNPKVGYEPPIILVVPGKGLLNAVGLENPGVECVSELVAEAKVWGLPLLVSVGGSSEEEFAMVAARAEELGADALELNLSCPHVGGYGLEIGRDPAKVYATLKAVTSVVRIPTFAKLGLVDDIVSLASKALEGGARGLTLINTVKAMYIDLYGLRPVLTNIFGGLSGAPIHPLAVRAVYEVYRELGAEILGCGGVMGWREAAELIAAGAKAVQVGTALALSRNPRRLVKEILRGLRGWLRFHGFKSVAEAVGAAHRR